MVTSNRNGGSDTPHWWDDLPPAVRRRVSRPEPEPRPGAADPAGGPSYRPPVVRDLTRLGVVFLLVALCNLLFLLLALSFLSNRGPFAP